VFERDGEMKQESLTMTVEEAAAALGISRNLAYEAARDGRIPAIRIGRRLLVPRRALERLLEVSDHSQAKGFVVKERSDEC